MSRVRYVNKKTGWVSIYESTSCYDPVKKTSRPKRTYIGYEDPITKEFVPSSGKPGRRKKSQTGDASASMPDDAPYYTKYKKALEELDKQRDENKALVEQIQSLQKQIEATNNAIDAFVRSVHMARR